METTLDSLFRRREELRRIIEKEQTALKPWLDEDERVSRALEKLLFENDHA